LDKNLPALVMKMLSDNMGLLPNIKQTEDNALYLLLEKQGSANPVWLNLSFRMFLPDCSQFEECDHISEMFTGFDVVIDDI
jgi:hypothetical protein